MTRSAFVFAVGALVSTGCYVSGGFGYAGRQQNATAHIAVGIRLPLGDRATARIGGGAALGGKHPQDAVPGPVVLGAEVRLRDLAGSPTHGLTTVVNLALPKGGSWLLSDGPSHVGRVYAGIGYQYIGFEPYDQLDGKKIKRPIGGGSVSVGPEVFWLKDAANNYTSTAGVCVDAIFMFTGWAVARALDAEDS